MSLRTALLPVVNLLRRIPGPSQIDVHTNRITLRTVTWSGGEIELGSPTIVDTPIEPTPHVREQNEGLTLIVGPITPAHVGGGYTKTQLNPADAKGVEFYYVVTGPRAGNYVLVGMDVSRPFRYMLTLRARDRKVPI